VRVREGVRKVQACRSGKVTQQEKGVDTVLTIAGCDAAADPELQWVCLFTNDGDYVPLVDRLRASGKAVFLAALCNPERLSSALVERIGRTKVSDRDALFSMWSQPAPTPTAFWFLLMHRVFKFVADAG
jgi:uncharacterized LabA/DUF88 family protein